MGATYTRQSSYSDGDTITAAHTNDEFNQLLAAFAQAQDILMMVRLQKVVLLQNYLELRLQ